MYVSVTFFKIKFCLLYYHYACWQNFLGKLMDDTLKHFFSSPWFLFSPSSCSNIVAKANHEDWFLGDDHGTREAVGKSELSPEMRKWPTRSLSFLQFLFKEKKNWNSTIMTISNENEHCVRLCQCRYKLIIWAKLGSWLTLASAVTRRGDLHPWQRSWGRRLDIRKGGIEPQESPWKFSSIYLQNQSLSTLLLCALTYTSDFTGGCPPPPLSEKELT